MKWIAEVVAFNYQWLSFSRIQFLFFQIPTNYNLFIKKSTPDIKYISATF